MSGQPLRTYGIKSFWVAATSPEIAEAAAARYGFKYSDPHVPVRLVHDAVATARVLLLGTYEGIDLVVWSDGREEIRQPPVY